MCLFSLYCPYNEKSKVGRWVSVKCIWGGKYKKGVKMTKKGCEKLFYPYFWKVCKCEMQLRGGGDQEWGKNDKKRAVNRYFIQTFH